MRALLAASLVVLAAGAARPASAQDALHDAAGEVPAPVTSFTRPPAIFGPQPGPPVEVHVSVEQDFQAGFHAYPGTVTLRRELLSIMSYCPLPGPLLFGLQLDAEGAVYDFENARRMVPGTDDPAQTLWTINASPRLYATLNSTVTLYLGSVFTFAGSLDAKVGDSIRYELDAATQVTVGDEIKLYFGAGIKTRLEARPVFYPILGIEWRRWRAFLEGSIVKLKAPLLETLDLVGSFGLDVREYRLADDAALAAGVLRDLRAPVSVGLGWRPIPGLEADVTVGAVLWQKFLFDDHLGRIVAKARTDPNVFFGLHVIFNF